MEQRERVVGSVRHQSRGRSAPLREREGLGSEWQERVGGRDGEGPAKRCRDAKKTSSESLSLSQGL
jgi:hypothetical protein